MSICISGQIAPYAVPGVKRVMITDIKVFEAIQAVLGISYEQMAVKSRNHELVLARQLYAFFMKRETRLSLSAIGRYFDQDHATALHSIKTINNLMDTDKTVRELVNRVETKLKPPFHDRNEL